MTPDADSRKPFAWLADRCGSDSLKWAKYPDATILPMWVADMDYRCAPPILEALHTRVDHGVFGYAAAAGETTDAVVQWLRTRHGWAIDPEWIVWVPGLVPALHAVSRAFAQADEDILTFTPIYPPFMSAPQHAGRKILTCPLVHQDGYYTIDFEALTAAVSNRTKVLLLCSPHNPVGRVWKREELLKLAEFCLEHKILICSDEIHCDLVLDTNARHIPTATLSNEIADNTVTLMSAAKTFNLPGLNCGFSIISNPQLRKRFKASTTDAIPHVNVMGYVACRAAFTRGLPWLEEVLEYLRENHRLLHHAVNEGMNGLSMGHVEATFLAWIDTRKLDLSNPADFFKQAGIAVLDGKAFGQPGFIRMNFACSREHLQSAIERMKKAPAVKRD